MRQYVYAWTALAVRIDTDGAGNETIRPHATVGVCLAENDEHAHRLVGEQAQPFASPEYADVHVSVMRVPDEVMMVSLGSAHECAPRHHRGRT